ncbi:hypothetical protein AB6C47_003030 [Vibrio cyclitrophicus]
MFKLLNKYFGGKSQSEKNRDLPVEAIQRQSLDSLFEKHFNESQFFKTNTFDIVIRHLKHEIDLNKSGTKLTANEKKELGLNARLSISSDLVAVLSKSGLELVHPKDALKQVYYRAKFEANRIESLQRMTSLGIGNVTYMACKDEKDCEWCKANDGVKFIVSEALNTEINQSCKCDWNRGCFIPDIN